MIDKDWLRKFSEEDLEDEPTVIGVSDEDDLDIEDKDVPQKTPSDKL